MEKELNSIIIRDSPVELTSWEIPENVFEEDSFTVDMDFLGRAFILISISTAFIGTAMELLNPSNGVLKFIDELSGKIFYSAHLHSCRCKTFGQALVFLKLGSYMVGVPILNTTDSLDPSDIPEELSDWKSRSVFKAEWRNRVESRQELYDNSEGKPFRYIANFLKEQYGLDNIVVFR